MRFCFLLAVLWFNSSALSQNFIEAIQKYNPDSKLIENSRYAESNIGNIINHYTPVLGLNPCNNELVVEDGSPFNIGDTVLLIQMKGTIVDSSNTSSFGNITDYKSAGNYEFNFISRKIGNILTLKNRLTRSYDIPVGKVQLVRVPYFSSARITATLTCLPWDGNKGGVLVLNVRDTVTLDAGIDVSSKGFPGAIGINTNQPGFNCFEDKYYYPHTAGDSAARKGEGIADISVTRIFGKGKLANAGGGGNSHNSGGGGGGNGGAGGLGGYQLQSCGIDPFDNRGIGGMALIYNNTNNKIFMGGGGGAGHVNNPQGFSGNGGNGGAIAIIRAGYLVNNGNSIISNGQDALRCTLSGSGCHEGMGGGGAGGTIIMDVSQILDNTSVSARGGKGGNMVDLINGRLGPGGGGGGGITWFKSATLPPNVNTVLSGGANGTCIVYSDDPWGASSGQFGNTLFNLLIPFDTILFTPNIDSVRIKDSAVSCQAIRFSGLAYTNTSPVANWLWNFGDGTQSSVQNPVHNFNSSGSFTIQLTVTDINGCAQKDSIQISVGGLTTILPPENKSICKNDEVQLFVSNIPGLNYSWSPGISLNDSTINNPSASPLQSTIYTLTVTGNLCFTQQTFPVHVNVLNLPLVSINEPGEINCANREVRLIASGAQTYSWTGSADLSSNTGSVVTVRPTLESVYTVIGTDLNGCSGHDSIVLKYENIRGQFELPNAFTPNGDGLNDCFGVMYWGDISDLSFVIYNRWGQKVFETKNPLVCWDGNFRGTPSDAGNYVYYIVASSPCGEMERKGNVLLIR